MIKKKRHLLLDIGLLTLSIVVALFIMKIGVMNNIVNSLHAMQWLGIIVAGVFFTSAFTTAPSIVVLGAFAETAPLPLLALLGGFGAVLGDYVIFRFMRDRITKDFEYIYSLSRHDRFFAIFKNRIFIFLLPFLGALIIASPLPDEIGIAMIGASKMKDRVFFLVSFVMNSFGIFVIGWIATAALGV